MDSTTRREVSSGAHRHHADPHAIHGLVAIANGPDYCLCGNHWPCRPQPDTAH